MHRGGSSVADSGSPRGILRQSRDLRRDSDPIRMDLFAWGDNEEEHAGQSKYVELSGTIRQEINSYHCSKLLLMAIAVFQRAASCQSREFYYVRGGRPLALLI